MQTTKNLDFQCPNCGFQSQSRVTTIIDPAHNPEAKQRLIAGQLNVVQCPNCGQPNTISTPIVYHDASKELLITFVPAQLGMSEQDADKFVGILTREVTDALDSKLIKGYIFQPRRSLTMQGLIEQVLEADGVSREELEGQKERSRLVQTFIQSEPDAYPALVQEHDSKLDEQFFQIMSIVAQRYLQEGREDIAEHVLVVQEKIAELSTFGKELLARTAQQEQIVREAAQTLDNFQTRPTPADLIALVKPHINDVDRLQAYVGLARPLFDYAFFEALTEEINQAAATERPQLEGLRDNILQLTKVVDEQAEMQLQAAANVLRQILTAGDDDAIQNMIQANINAIDDTFMTVLELNIREAERQGDIAASARMKSIREKVIEALQSRMRPEVRFINELMMAESQSTAREMLEKHAAQFGNVLLETFDTLREVIEAQGETQVVERLDTLKAMAQEILG